MDVFWEMFQSLVLGGVFVSLLLFVPLWGPQLVFRKLFPARDESRRFRFSLKDGMLLVIILAVINAFISQLLFGPSEIQDDTTQILLVLSLDALIVLLWVKCYRFMAEIGIEKGSARILMLFVLYPLSTFLVSTTALGVMMFLSSLELLVEGPGAGLRSFVSHEIPQLSFCLVVISLSFIFLIRYLFAKFVVHQTAKANPQLRDTKPLSDQ